MKQITLQSTVKGYTGNILWHITTIVEGIGMLIFSMISFSEWHAQKGTSFTVQTLLGASSPPPIPMILSYIAYWGGIGFIVIGIFGVIIAILYGPTTKIIFELGDDGKIVKMHYEDLNFIHKKEIREVMCNQIIQISIDQSTIGSMNGTGSMKINFVSFANANIEDQTWKIPAVEDPMGKKKEIMAASPQHEGFQVKQK